MAFDKETRNLLAKTVTACRRRLIEDVTDQLRGVFGLHPDGTVLPLEKLTHLTPGQVTAARRLRDLLDHYAVGASGSQEERRWAAYERMRLEISFTALNRLAALRLCEERGLVIECVRKGTASDGFRLFERISGGALGTRYDAYRVFLECLFDELALDLGVLFDRLTPQSAVFPTERCLEDVLAELNKPKLTHLWTEDETIGWIYQYFNPPEERKAMREASQAPRNSRELAVRNQFFTPRYVVEFLTDNTLGRIWYEMRQGDTALKEECRYLVRRPNEVFLGPGEKAPDPDDADGNLSQEELLKKPVYIEPRPQKDPRDLLILDPAGGSCHFLLYAFDLLETIYAEAWEDRGLPASEATGRTLREDYASLDELRRAVPELILRHNLHGIDIDPRAVQIGALALWLRAQKSWQTQGLKAAERPRITKSNIVCAEPMPGEDDLRREFTAALQPRVLGQLVELIFEKMKLAGEAGSLLKIEAEIQEAVARAKDQWLKAPQPEQAVLFPEMMQHKPEQHELFEVKDITADEFWHQAEERIFEALKEYSEQAENGHTRRRLFAEDAARGFAFIDLCRKRYDVVLMNPPFGAFSRDAKAYGGETFPNSANDIFAAFVERFLASLEPSGLIGAITSRTAFFIASFADWRREILRKKTRLLCFADLGMGVMDNATVEAAAYVIEPTVAATKTDKFSPFFRILVQQEKQLLLAKLIEDLRESHSIVQHLFFAGYEQFALLHDTPFVYWAQSDTLKKLMKWPSFEPSIAQVRKGLRTGDNYRFIRALWEIPQTEFTPGISSDETSAQRERSKWVPLILSGASQPWFSPLLVAINWKKNGQELRQYVTKYGTPSRLIQAEDFYFKTGMSWTRRAARFIPYAIPTGCIPTGSRPMAFPKTGREFVMLAVSSSLVASAFMRFYGDWFTRPNFLEGKLKLVPWPNISEFLAAALHSFVGRESDCRRNAYQGHEPFLEFTRPFFLDSNSVNAGARIDWSSLLGVELEVAIEEAFGLDRSEATELYRDLQEALEARGVLTEEQNKDEDGDGEGEFLLDISERSRIDAIASYAIGIAFGRWEVRIALDPSLAAKLQDPFAPLPVCPPGMLVGPDGLPAEPGGIVSEEWLRARPDAGTMPPEGAVMVPTVPEAEYPLRISWDGVLVDDLGFNGAPPHREDIVWRVREVLDLIWKDKAPDIEQEACDILGVSDLRDYFRKPSGFFQDHLKRYSKSRRKAPIYWPLSTASGSYTVWLYYHRLTGQTLFAVVNKYVEPKIAEVERGSARIEDELPSASGRDAAHMRDRLHEGRTFLGELRDFKEELLRVATLPYKPNLNDGVIINAAPLHKLFRLRSWANETEECWKKLQKGDYDWAHLAYTIWPDRVRDACKKDRSIAIAHGLEDLCEVKAPAAKQKGGRRKKESAL